MRVKSFADLFGSMSAVFYEASSGFEPSSERWSEHQRIAFWLPKHAKAAKALFFLGCCYWTVCCGSFHSILVSVSSKQACCLPQLCQIAYRSICQSIVSSARGMGPRHTFAKAHACVWSLEVRYTPFATNDEGVEGDTRWFSAISGTVHGWNKRIARKLS